MRWSQVSLAAEKIQSPTLPNQFMTRPILHCILLIAVAYSQIFGGVSCCCLVRFALGGNQAVAFTDSDNALQVKPQSSRCPRCTASVTQDDDKSGDDHASLQNDGKCQCAKAVAGNAIQESKTTFDDSDLLAIAPRIGWHADLTRSTVFASRLGSVLHPRRNSWQSIACVWTL